jgi:hypothetical protein
MQTARIVQAVVLMMIVAVAASCTASKAYTSKLFAPRTPVIADSQPAVATLRFLELDKVDADQSNWVSTDIIMGRDTMSKTLALDKLAETFPASPIANNANVTTELANKTSTPASTNPVPKENTVLAKRDKKAKKGKIIPAPVPEEIKPVVEESVPVARNINSEEVRSKRTREK